MALEVTYYVGVDRYTKQIRGQMLSRATVTLTGSSASLGTPPTNATYCVITAGEACVVSNNGAVTATNGQYLAANAVVELSITHGAALYGQTP